MKCPTCGQSVSDKETEKELLEIVRRVTGRNFRVLPRGTMKTLKSFSLAEIEQALTNLAADSWHQPKLKELSLGYLLRAETIDKFLEAEKSMSRIEALLAREVPVVPSAA